MIFYAQKPGNTLGRPVYFDHTNICDISPAVGNNGCIITLANGTNIECSGSVQDVVDTIATSISRPDLVTTAISLDI